jgi:hypothetical protein
MSSKSEAEDFIVSNVASIAMQHFWVLAVITFVVDKFELFKDYKVQSVTKQDRSIHSIAMVGRVNYRMNCSNKFFV